MPKKPKTPAYQLQAVERWRSKQQEQGAQRVEFLLTAEEVTTLAALAAQHGSRRAALRWLLKNAIPAKAKPADGMPNPAKAKPENGQPNPAKGSQNPPQSTRGKGARQGEADRRAALAPQAQALRNQGWSWQRIAAQWDSQGVLTLRGGAWDPSSVRAMVLRYERRQEIPDSKMK